VPYWYSHNDPDGNSSGYGNRSLAVVIGREETWVLEGTIDSYQSQLGASQNGIGIKVGHVEAVHDRQGLSVAVE
jgi:hypothetical protein